MTDFDKLLTKAENSMNGHREPSLPMGFDRLERYVSIRKKMYYLVGGYTGLLTII